MGYRWLAVFFILFLFLCGSQVVYGQQNKPKIPQPGANMREYLPGDIVRMVIDAPIDTSSILAVMPDKQELEMRYDSRTNSWYGYWEVPQGIKKGIYYAMMLAKDVEGNAFEGASTAFYIGEPVLSLMIRLTPSYEGTFSTKGRRIVSQEVQAVEPETPVIEAPVVAEKPPIEVEEEEEISPVVEKKVKAVLKHSPAYKAELKQKQKTLSAVKTNPDANIKKSRMIVSARSYMARADYKSARSELKALLKIDPNNKDVKVILSRLENIIKSKGN